MAAATCAGLGALKVGAPAEPSIPPEPLTEQQRLVPSPCKHAEVPLGWGDPYVSSKAGVTWGPAEHFAPGHPSRHHPWSFRHSPQSSRSLEATKVTSQEFPGAEATKLGCHRCSWMA